MREKLPDKKWFPYTLAACIAVVLYVTLTHLPSVLKVVATFIGFFSTPLLGCVLAYLMNPLAMFFNRTVFKAVKSESVRWMASITLTVLTLVLFIALLLSTLIPQLVESVTMLAGNLDGYIATLIQFAHRWGIAEHLKIDELVGTSGSIMVRLLQIARENMQNILDMSMTAGKGLVMWLLAFILSIYMLASKESIRDGLKRLMRALLSERDYKIATSFLTRCDVILQRYIVFNVVDALIIGGANAVFMASFSMQYVGLVSLFVGVTNLIPTIGPVIGGVLGGFVLLLVNPIHALIFLVFTAVLQGLDGYFIKPKLFGNTLGVSGLLILVFVIVCGKMWGIVGVLLAIPLAAIVDDVCKDAILPQLEERRRRIDAEANEDRRTS